MYHTRSCKKGTGMPWYGCGTQHGVENSKTKLCQNQINLQQLTHKNLNSKAFLVTPWPLLSPPDGGCFVDRPRARSSLFLSCGLAARASSVLHIRLGSKAVAAPRGWSRITEGQFARSEGKNREISRLLRFTVYNRQKPTSHKHNTELRGCINSRCRQFSPTSNETRDI